MWVCMFLHVWGTHMCESIPLLFYLFIRQDLTLTQSSLILTSELVLGLESQEDTPSQH